MKNSYPILIFDPDDNVATAIRALAAGTAVAECLQTCEQIPFAFKVALRDIPAGTYLRNSGIYIGRAAGYSGGRQRPYSQCVQPVRSSLRDV